MIKKNLKKIVSIILLIISLTILLYILNLHMFPKAVMQLSLKRYGAIESYIKIEDDKNLHYICKTNTKLVNTNFERVFGLFWSKTVVSFYDINDIFDSQVNIKYLSTNSSDEYVVFGISNNASIVILKLKTVKGSIVELYPKQSGLFAAKVKNNASSIEGYDAEGNIIYRRDIQGILQ